MCRFLEARVEHRMLEILGGHAFPARRVCGAPRLCSPVRSTAGSLRLR